MAGLCSREKMAGAHIRQRSDRGVSRTRYKDGDVKPIPHNWLLRSSMQKGSAQAHLGPLMVEQYDLDRAATGRIKMEEE